MGTGGTTALQPPGSGALYQGTARSDESSTERERGGPQALGHAHGFAPTLTGSPHAAASTSCLLVALPAICGRSHLGVSFALRCFQRFSPPHVSYSAVLLAEQPIHRWCVHPGPLVLGTAPRKPPAPTTDRDRTVSRRSEPSSRTALMGEQPNPWDLLRPQDATSRHRGAKPCRRCELLGKISLLSPG